MAEETSTKRTRASGEVLDYLLREFDSNPNPSPDQRKEISERTNMSEKAVRIWFQNRRAKVRKFERMGKPVKHGGSNVSSRSNLLTQVSAAGLRAQGMIPIELNENYCFIDCSSLSVGSWQRIKSGQHNGATLLRSLVNLSPFTLNSVMENVDLMVILSRKNHEINYFFSAISNNSKILFRIFYPISSVLHSSILDSSLSKENNEMRLNLARKPKFSVYFFNGVNANLNQWSICDDFSEGQQVSSAFYAPGGTSTPHVLVGAKNSLQFLNNYILSNQLLQKEYAGVSETITPLAATGSPRADGLPNNMIHSQNHNDDYQIKQDVSSWEDTPHSEKPYALKGLTLIANFEDTSPMSSGSHESPGVIKPRYNEEKQMHISSLGVNQPERKEYEEMFSATTPDFFNTVQTPNSNFLPHVSKSEGSHFINSPSMGIESYENDSQLEKNLHSRQENVDIHRPENEYNQGSHDMANTYEADSGYHPQQVEHHYDFESNDFHPNELIINSPALSNGTPNTASSNAHVDNFIDFNAH